MEPKEVVLWKNQAGEYFKTEAEAAESNRRIAFMEIIMAYKRPRDRGGYRREYSADELAHDLYTNRGEVFRRLKAYMEGGSDG